MPREPLKALFAAFGVVAPTLLRATATSSRLPFGHPRPGYTYPTRPGFTLWLAEEFDTALDLDTDPIWTWSDGGLGEGQVRFVKEAIKFEDGRMIIEVSNASAMPEVAARLQSCSHAEATGVGPKDLLSGEFRTKHNIFRYGFYEVRMMSPSVQPGDAEINGNYISTMFAFRDAKYKHWREIDIEVTGDSKNRLTMNVLNAENHVDWSPAIQSSQKHVADGADLRREFHDYAFEWLPSGITWFVDGNVVGRHGPEKPLPIPELSTKIMMNLWVFRKGWGFGGPNGPNNRYPLRSQYDWFRFYKWNGDDQYPCADGGDSCLTEDDHYLAGNNPCDGIQQQGLFFGNPVCRAKCPYSEVGLGSGNATLIDRVDFLLP